MVRLLAASLLLLATASLHAATYDIEWRLAFDAKTKTAQGSLTLGKGAGEVSAIDFNFPAA